MKKIWVLALVMTGVFFMANQADAEQYDRAVFAGGCFWCMEPPYDVLDGVIKTTSGYIGGRTENPTYKEVSAGGSGHLEAIEVVYDPAVVTYDTLLKVFWRNIDPLDDEGQFCDKGESYRSAIFYLNDEQKEKARASKKQIAGQFDDEIATEVREAATFYKAEHYHQDYYTKNPVRYKYYRYRCGRDQRLKTLWGE